MTWGYDGLLGRPMPELDMEQNRPEFCWGDVSDLFYNNMVAQMWRINALLMVNAILMGVMVGIGAYGHRYRQHPITRFIFLGTTALFLPIVSSVVSTSGNQNFITASLDRGNLANNDIVIGACDTTNHINLVLIWTALVQIVGMNTTAIVASDAREGRNIGPPPVLIVQAVWTSYLAVYNAGYQGSLGYNNTWSVENVFSVRGWIVLSLFAVIFAKILYKCYAWSKARQSLLLGRNPRLTVGYMNELQDGISHHPEIPGEHIPPPLIVMGEDTLLSVDTQPHGYSFKYKSNRFDIGKNNCISVLVTIDQIWQLDGMPLTLTAQLKDTCFSFALLKILRCRFAKYAITEAGFTKACKFLRHMLLQDSDDQRILRLIEYELCFLNDCYYSSLPISYSKSWLPILGIFISLLTIGCCLVTTIIMFPVLVLRGGGYEIMCLAHCTSDPTYKIDYRFGNPYFDLVQVCLLVALVVLTEVREIASCIFSSWTKVALICCYVRNASWLKSPTIRKCIGRILQHRCKLLRHWEDKMNQCSILVLHSRRTPMAFIRHCIHLPDQNKKVPRAVKSVIVDALRNYEKRRASGLTYLRRTLQLKFGDRLLWTSSGDKGIADTMLVCHIATSIFEVRSRSRPHVPPSDYKTAATHLSRYCVYLVAYHPELLPDDDEWCKSLYKEVKKDADRLLPGSIVTTPEEQCRDLIQLLGASAKHEVLKNGAVLGGRLAELVVVEGEEMVWKVLANFWSELILYVAPSDNMDGHAEATARGGELITLLWALQAHLGTVSRLDSTDAAASIPV